MTATTTYVAAMPIEDAATNSDDALAATRRISDTGDEDDSDGPLPTTPDDAVYCNKQLTAHLIKQVCSRKPPCLGNGATGSNSSSSSNRSSRVGSNNNNNNNHVLVGTAYDRSNSVSTRSHSPDEATQPEQISDQHPIRHHHLHQQQQQQQQLHHQSQSLIHRDSVDGGPASSSSSSGYLSASSASGLSAPSTAYVSPFALSPLDEEARSPWSRPAISLDVIQSARTAELEGVLFRLCDEFEDRLHGRFDSFSSRLDTQPATIRESVTRELETLFYDDNVHWGRIIAVFVLTKEICDKCLAEGRPELSAAVQQWVAEFIDQHLWRWVRQNQGWYGLIKFYQETGGDQAGCGAGASLFSSGSVWQSMALLLTLSAASIAIALTASYFRR